MTDGEPPVDRGFGFEHLAKPTANGDSITNRKHANLNSWVGGERLVELEHEVPVVPNVLAERRVRWCHHGAIPKGVVIADHAADLDQLDQPLVVVQVVVLVSVHKDEVKCSMVLPL